MRIELPIPNPLDLEITFTCGQAFRWAPAGSAWRGIVEGAEIEVRVAGPPGAERLHIASTGSRLEPRAWERYFRLDEDPLAHFAAAPELRSLPGLEPLLGLRLLRQEPWETLATFIASAAANFRKISGCVEGLAERWGDPIAGAGRRTFPPPARIARASEAELRRIGLGFRAPYLRAAARAVDSPRWSWTALRELPYPEARERLCALPGVGAKVADCVLLFGLDRLEAYPVDRWIRRATLELSGRRAASDAELSRWAERFGPGRGYVQQILFHLRRTGGPLPRFARLRAPAGAGVGAE